jgi:D-3-phosphoglycerate dehydrogenase
LPKILHLDEKPALTPSAKAKIAHFENVILPEDAPEEVVLQEIKDAKYVISGAREVGAKHFDAAPNLHAVVLPSAGYDYVDVAAATERGVYVINSPGANSNAVAEMAVGLMLAISRKIPQSYARVRAGEWVDENVRVKGLGDELTGKTMGLVGLGNIGSRVAKIASHGFNMEVLCYTRRPSPEREQKAGVKFVPINELMARADFVVICAALTDSTRGLIGKEQLALMKETAYLINAARGPIVDYDALYTVCVEKKIAGAAIDVMYVEPPGATHPFFELDNIIVTPHLGSRTRDANERVTNLVADEIVRMEAGEKPLNNVNLR